MRTPPTTPGLVALVLAFTVLVTGAVSAGATTLSIAERKCQAAVAGAASKYFSALLVLSERCDDANLASPGACVAPDPARVAKLDAKLRATIATHCDLPAAALARIGFPGACPDPAPGADFDVAALQDCMAGSHAAAVTEAVAVLHPPAVVGPFSLDAMACQRRIARGGTRFLAKLLPAIGKCRNSALADRLPNVLARRCATDDPATASTIAKLEAAFRKSVGQDCTDPLVGELHVCGTHATVGDAMDCLIGVLRRMVDVPTVATPPELIDYEYAEARTCGDGSRNRPAEECDGSDDALCPGLCGSPSDAFACLCLDRPRQRVIEHGGDFDGPFGHDMQLSEGAGWIADLTDCDGPSGPDSVCTVAASAGPHGPPLPVVAGGVAVCLVNTLTEAVTGTTDLATGAGSVRVRLDRATYLPGTQNQPCPVCGGFCAGPAGELDPGSRSLCTSDADCPAGVRCIGDPVCSYGPNIDRPCRPTADVGTPSVDCRPAGPPLDTHDLLFEFRTTGGVTLAPTVACHAGTFAGDACIGGSQAGRPCTGPAQCPSGTCAPQCFCAGQAVPNTCPSACVGGGADAQACASDGDCPGGFCHAGDCRADAGDADSIQEGHCSALPSRQCFVNGGIARAGVAGVPDRTTAGVGCVPATGNAAVDVVAGLPSPMALTQPETTLVTGF